MGRAIKHKVRGAIAPTVFLALVTYFAWNVIDGDRGLRAYAQRQQLLRQAQAELAQAEQERDAWERRASGLRNPHIDRDTLDERARAMLNMADPADVIIPYGPKDRLF
ncbi:MAG: septum formation initiator family protein [Acetobacteraceae bacterium]|nr:septum formation initiator family protein [Acetobacteraceae bacterium]